MSSRAHRHRQKRKNRNKANKRRRHRALVRNVADRLLGVEHHWRDSLGNVFKGEPGTVIEWEADGATDTA